MKAATGFDAFWAAYPRRQKKKDARKAWDAVRPDAVLVETILAALGWQRQQPQWVKDDGQFIPLPASYLRGEQWDDEPVEVSPVQMRGRGLNVYQIVKP